MSAGKTARPPDANATFARRPFVRHADAFKSGSDTPSVFLDRCLAAIDAHNGGIRAFVTMNVDAARKAADAATARWRAGKPLSPIDGMPVGIKDVIETVDMPTGMGSPLYDGWRSQRDSATVYALREAGAVVVGKTVTTEFAATVPGPTRNPHDLSRTPGGSSSGSAAAVGAGFLSAALGTQVVGSILRPASYCGAWGFKPTVGALNRGGSHDYMSQSCAGVIAASADDCWAVACAIAERAGGDPGAPGLYVEDEAGAYTGGPLTLASLRFPGWDKADPRAVSALDGVLDRLRKSGIAVRDVDLSETLAPALPLTRKINGWESRWPLNTYADRAAGKLSAAMHDRLREAEAMTLSGYRADTAQREAIRRDYAKLAETASACITLSAPGVAPQGIAATGDPIFAVPSSLLGVPAISMPLATIDGLPLGIQLVGFRDKDATLFAIARRVAAVMDLA